MADVFVDPFEFVEEEYEPNPGTEDFSESFMELFDRSEDESDAEFNGFTREAVFLAQSSRVQAFHLREETREHAGKENEEPGRARKTIPDPSR